VISEQENAAMKLRHVFSVVMMTIGIAAATGAAQADVLFSAMEGGNQVPVPRATRLAFGTATLIRNGQGLCFALLAVGLDSPVVEFHIHKGIAGTNDTAPNPLVVFVGSGGLPPSVIHGFNPATGSGCVPLNNVTTQTLNDIFLHPRHYYINVHTQKTDGAIRGQLF